MNTYLDRQVENLLGEIGLNHYGSWEISSDGTCQPWTLRCQHYVSKQAWKTQTRKFHDEIPSQRPNVFGTQCAAGIDSSVPVTGSLELWCQRLAGTISPWKTDSKERERNSFLSSIQAPSWLDSALIAVGGSSPHSPLTSVTSSGETVSWTLQQLMI